MTIRIENPASQPDNEAVKTHAMTRETGIDTVENRQVQDTADSETKKIEPVVDPLLQEILLQARELASTWQSEVPYQPTSSYKRKLHKKKLSLRELFVESWAIGLAIGAMLLVLVHAFGADYHIVQTRQAVSVSVPAADNPSSANLRQIRVPGLSLWIYEAGIYRTVQSAQSAVSDYRKSGVRPVIAPLVPSASAGAAGRYALLLGSTMSTNGSPAFETWLQHAQVPYFVRPWIIPTHVVSFHKKVPASVQALLSTDVQLLEALVAVSSGYDVSTVQPLAHQSEQLRLQNRQIMTQTTPTIQQIRTFDDAVQGAWQALHSAGPYGTMLQLAKAITAYTHIQ